MNFDSGVTSPMLTAQDGCWHRLWSCCTTMYLHF